MLERGMDISYEKIRRWTVKFGLPINEWLAAFRLYAVRNPQSFLCPSPPPLCPHHPLPPNGGL